MLESNYKWNWARADQSEKAFRKIKEMIERWPINKNDDTKLFYLLENELTAHCSVLMLGNRVIIPTKVLSQVLINLHQEYVGIVKIKSLAKNYVY